MIEIAAFRYDGTIQDQLISLIHPHKEIQKYVSKITGITPNMLVRAPRFHEIAKRILEITEDAVLVGHNVEFDYRMLRQEFERLGYQYERKTLDTIKLSEELIPGLEAYGLEKITRELGIFHSRKHRAESDARATLELFKVLQEKDQKKGINTIGQSIKSSWTVKDKVQDLKRGISNNRGLFYLHDQEGKLLYMGVSNNIKNSVNKLFLADNKRALELRKRTFSLKTEESGNWLVAKLKRFAELHHSRPEFNKAPHIKLNYGLYENGGELHVGNLKSINGELIVRSQSARDANRAVRMYKRGGKEAEERLNAVKEVENKGNQIFTGKGRGPSERCAFYVEDSLLKGYYYYDLNDRISTPDRFKKNMTSIESQEAFTELLKLGILTGEFEKADFAAS